MADYSQVMRACKPLAFCFALGLVISAPFAREAVAMSLPDDKNAAVVYAFFHIGNDGDGSASLSQENFESLLAEITNPAKKYNPVSLTTIIDAQKNNVPLPVRTISLTFEMPDASFMNTVFPLLEKHKLPFTVFLSPGSLDTPSAGANLTWDDVKKIQKYPQGTIGITAYHYERADGKSTENLLLDINNARTRIREKTGAEVDFFSYPFGEYTPDYMKAVAKQDFTAAFGLQSGVVGVRQSRLALPRFTITDDFADIERFRMTSAALPLPVTEIHPAGTLAQSNPPSLSFTLAADLGIQLDKKIDCFTSGLGKTSLVSDNHNRFNLSFPDKFEPGRARVNCTMPTPPPVDADGNETGEDARWRWLGFLISVPEKKPSEFR